MKIISNIYPARLMAAAEAVVALIAAFLPLSGQQVATILGVVAVLTGEQVVRKVRNPYPVFGNGWGSASLPSSSTHRTW